MLSRRLLTALAKQIAPIQPSCLAQACQGGFSGASFDLLPTCYTTLQQQQWPLLQPCHIPAATRHKGSRAASPIPVHIDPHAPTYEEPKITREEVHERASQLYVDPFSIKHTAPCSILPFPEGFNPQAMPKQYSVVGSISGPYKVDRKQAFAIVVVGGSQYKVTPTDLLYVEKLEAKVNDVVALQHVMMVGTPAETVVGRPYLPAARVEAVVEEQFRDAKVLNFKKRRRKNSKRLKGHRQPLTALRIVSIVEAGLLQDGISDLPWKPLQLPKKLRR